MAEKDPINFRLSPEIAERLGEQAERHGMSRQAYVNEVLKLQAEFGHTYPAFVPVGLSPLSKELECPDKDSLGKPRANAWLVAYMTWRGIPVALPCEVRSHTLTSFLLVSSNPYFEVSVPRTAIMYWVHCPKADNSVISELVHMNKYGVLLHDRAIVGGARENGIVQAPPGTSF